jgi:predicted 2-oxoglutarate/Fe(II)-dependent dioxygenase YbiX
METLQDFIFKINLVPDDVCDLVVDQIAKDTNWYRHSYEKKGQYKKSVFPPDEFETLHSNDLQRNILLPIIEDSIKMYNNFLINNNSFEEYQSYTGITSCSNVKFNRCKPHTRVHVHHDHIHELFGENNKSIPVLSVVGLLNDEFEGGEFIVFKDYNIQLKKGDILLFPSTFLYPHRVEQVKKGTRYSFVTWAF